jgi:hypothetical protein
MLGCEQARAERVNPFWSSQLRKEICFSREPFWVSVFSPGDWIGQAVGWPRLLLKELWRSLLCEASFVPTI